MSADAVVVLWGPSEFLLRDAALDLLGEARPTEVDAAAWEPGATAGLATPSLLGEPRSLLVSRAQDLPEEALEEVARYAADPDPEARLALLVGVSPRAKGPPARVTRALQGRAAVRRVAVERKDLARWVEGRAKRRGIPVSAAGAQALVQTVGEDPGELDQAVAQIGDAYPEEGLTRETVAAQFRGLGDRRIWELADAAFGRDARAAVRHLVAMLAAGEEPLAILGGLAARLRDLIRVRALADLPPRRLAEAAGLRFDWQARRYREQAARFTEEELADLHARMADADRQLKMGGAGDVVLAMVVARIAGEPAGARG